MFCILEKDEKTYNFFQEYLEVSSKEELFHLDQIHQFKEIKQYLQSNNLSDNNDKKCEWILKYSKTYRIYLNTVKTACFAYKLTHDLIGKIQWKTFCETIDHFNKNKDYLESIYS